MPSAKPARLALGIAVFIGLAAVFYWTRRRLRRLSAENNDHILKTSMFETPMATALLLSLLGSRWIYAQAPRLLWVLVGRARADSERDHRRAPDHTGAAPAALRIDRVLFYRPASLACRRDTVLAAPAIPSGNARRDCAFALAGPLAKARGNCGFRRKPEPRRWTTFVGYMALSISFTAFLANVLGYVTLANLLGNGLLKSSYLALVLYAFVVVLR